MIVRCAGVCGTKTRRDEKLIDEKEAEKIYGRREILKNLKARTRDSLIDEVYNHYVSSMANDDDKHHGKAIPYIGWFWRRCDFVEKRISIGDCGDFIGIMENNKWGYPERYMTEDEVNKLIELLERAMSVSYGSGKDISFYKSKRLDDLWDWMQTLKI